MAQRTLDDLDTRLLTLIQEEVPLVPEPFAAIAARAGTDEAEVLRRLESLKAGPRAPIRQVSAIFDSKALGYQTSLIAARVPAGRLEAAVAVVNAHPGVSHNYERNHSYNLWYTVAVPPDSRLGLEGTVNLLHARSGAEVTRLMPTLRLFKIGVALDLSAGADRMATREGAPKFAEAQHRRAMSFAVTDADRRMIRVLQQDLPIAPRPFDAWAAQAGTDVETLLSAARQYGEQHRMRRFSAVLRHREVGFAANAMGAWVVPVEQQEPFGERAATFASVSHCYLRPTYPDWPYSIFTMVHAPTRADCESVLAAISAATGVTGYAALYSTREFKKTRVKYFVGDIEQWETEAAGE